MLGGVACQIISAKDLVFKFVTDCIFTFVSVSHQLPLHWLHKERLLTIEK